MNPEPIAARLMATWMSVNVDMSENTIVTYYFVAGSKLIASGFRFGQSPR